MEEETTKRPSVKARLDPHKDFIKSSFARGYSVRKVHNLIENMGIQVNVNSFYRYVKRELMKSPKLDLRTRQGVQRKKNIGEIAPETEADGSRKKTDEPERIEGAAFEIRRPPSRLKKPNVGSEDDSQSLDTMISAMSGASMRSADEDRFLDDDAFDGIDPADDEDLGRFEPMDERDDEDMDYDFSESSGERRDRRDALRVRRRADLDKSGSKRDLKFEKKSLEEFIARQQTKSSLKIVLFKDEIRRLLEIGASAKDVNAYLRFNEVNVPMTTLYKFIRQIKKEMEDMDDGFDED